jgi:hypothetical protein
VALHRSEPSPAETLTASAAVSTITEEMARVKDQPKHCHASPEPKFKHQPRFIQAGCGVVWRAGLEPATNGL